MRKGLLLEILVIACFTTGCSHDVVKGIKSNERGDLIVTKCEEKYLIGVGFMVGWTSNCREEVKPKPVLPTS